MFSMWGPRRRSRRRYSRVDNQMIRKVKYNIDPDLLKALDDAIEACELGDVPDITVGIIGNLMLSGWQITRKRK